MTALGSGGGSALEWQLMAPLLHEKAEVLSLNPWPDPLFTLEHGRALCNKGIHAFLLILRGK